MNDIVYQLRRAAEWSRNQDFPAPDWDELMTSAAAEIQLLRAEHRSWIRAADEIERLRKATGGLDPALVAKALACVGHHGPGRWSELTPDDFAALRAATFEVPE